MRALVPLASIALLAAACTGGDGGTGDGFPGLWQYQPGSFSFVNCYFTSRTVDLTRSGFQIVDEAGTLVRLNTDGCRFRLVQSTALHADGVAGEQCVVQGTDSTTRYTLKSLLLELKPDDASEMIEVFDLDSEQTLPIGTYDCEISGNNTLDRGP